jgi:hypothetical protein
VYVQKDASAPVLISICHGLSAVVPFGLPDVRPGLRFELKVLLVCVSNVSSYFRRRNEGLRSVADQFLSWLFSRAMWIVSNLKLGPLFGLVDNALGVVRLVCEYNVSL